MTVHENGQNAFDLHRLLGLYHPKEMFLPKIGMEVFKEQESYIEGADAVGTSAAECSICKDDFSDDGNVLNGWSCNVCTRLIYLKKLL
jgi:hypothetical protein